VIITDGKQNPNGEMAAKMRIISILASNLIQYLTLFMAGKVPGVQGYFIHLDFAFFLTILYLLIFCPS